MLLKGKSVFSARITRYSVKILRQDEKSGPIRIIVSPSGSGKTICIKTVLAKYPDIYQKGVIVAAERIKDAEKLARKINKKAGKEIAAVLRGRHADLCKQMKIDALRDRHSDDVIPIEVRNRIERMEKRPSKEFEPKHISCWKCDYKDCPAACPEKYNSIRRYPIVIITHSMLIGLIETGNHLGKVKKWGEGQRKILIIDERPALFKHHSVSQSFVRRKLEKFRRENKSKNLQRGCRFLLKRLEEGKGRFRPKKIKLGASKKRSNSKFGQAIRALTAQGGLIVRDKDDNFITGKFLDLRKLKMEKALIFDATARLDPMYDLFPKGTKKFKIFTRKEGKIRLHHFPYQRYKAGLIRASEKSDSFEKEEKIIDQICSTHPGKKVPIFTTKDQEDFFKQFEKSHNVSVHHYMALKGKNDFRRRSVLYLTHIFQAPLNAHRAVGFVKGEDYEMTFMRKNFADKFSMGFPDPRLEAIRIRDLVCWLYQDIYRLRIREGKPVDVYLGITDLTIVNFLIERFPWIEWIKEPDFRKS